MGALVIAAVLLHTTSATILSSFDEAKLLRVDAILVLGGGAPPAPDAQLPFVAARCKAAAALWKAAAKKPNLFAETCASLEPGESVKASAVKLILSVVGVLSDGVVLAVFDGQEEDVAELAELRAEALRADVTRAKEAKARVAEEEAFAGRVIVRKTQGLALGAPSAAPAPGPERSTCGSTRPRAQTRAAAPSSSRISERRSRTRSPPPTSCSSPRRTRPCRSDRSWPFPASVRPCATPTHRSSGSRRSSAAGSCAALPAASANAAVGLPH